MKEISRYYVRLLMFLIPVVFLPVSVDVFGVGKNILIMMLALVGLVVWLVEMLVNKKDSLKLNKAWGLMALVTVWAWVGWYRMPEGVRMRSLMDVSGVGMLTAGLILFFLWLQMETEEERRLQLNWLTAAGILTAVGSIIIFLIPGAKLPISWPKDNPIISISSAWSLTGSVLSEAILMLILMLEWGKKLALKLKNQIETDYILEAIMVSVLTLIFFLDIFKIVKAGWINLDGTSAWVIAVETFKRSPIWGVGSGNFLSAFNSFRPESYNLTSTWASGFLHANSGILNLWTELGLLGLVAVIVSLLGFLKLKKNFDYLILAVMILVNMFLPVTLLGILLLIWTVVNVTRDNKKVGLVLKVGDNGFNAAPIVLSLLFVGLVGYSGYWLVRITMADFYIRQSLISASKNDGGGTYNLQIKAIGLNPTMAEYRRIYSQTNIALASTLLANKDITDDDKQKASTLIQQSVREAKAAIALDGTNPTYWTNLAVIYRQLVGVVDGSADWSFQAYQQAAVFDPVNPITKLDLGGLLFAANRFDEADRVFEQTVTVKPDFANAWYNWAYSAKQLNRLGDAVQRLTQAVALVPASSGDYEKANKELISWKKEYDEAVSKQKAQQQAAAAQAPKEAETLKTPAPLPTANKEEVVNVPASDLQPPKAEITPVVQPSPSVTP